MALPSESVIDNRTQLQTGMIMIIAAMLILPGIDAIAKSMTGSVSSGQVTWSRFLFQTLLLFPIVLVTSGWRGFRVGRAIWMHAARGVLIAMATLLFFTALNTLPMADTIAIFFVEPFILTLLSAVLLRERVGWRRLAAVAVGFVGALVIIRPSYQVFGLAALLPVGAACAFSIYIILTRLLVQGGNPITMQFYAGIFGFFTMTLGLLYGAATDISILSFVLPNAQEWMFLAALGAIATAGHMLIVLAVRRIGAGLMAPFQYLEIISATILGFVFFGDFPDVTTWVGVIIIIASGLYVFYRERKLADIV